MAKITIKKLNRSWLGDATDDKLFWCHDGRVLRNLDELAAALNEMAEETYLYHANIEKNDFSNWVRDVIGDATLAGQLTKAATQKAAARKVDMRLGTLRASSRN